MGTENLINRGGGWTINKQKSLYELADKYRGRNINITNEKWEKINDILEMKSWQSCKTMYHGQVRPAMEKEVETVVETASPPIKKESWTPNTEKPEVDIRECQPPKTFFPDLLNVLPRYVISSKSNEKIEAIYNLLVKIANEFDLEEDV